MEDNRPPLEFANRVIRRFIDNLFGDETLVLPQDYIAMRVVFRKLGGSWEKVFEGDTQLIIQIVQSWGNLKDKNRKVELGY